MIRESRLRPRLMDSVHNFTNIGIMIPPNPMRPMVKREHRPEQDLYSDNEYEYPVALHGMVAGAEEESRLVREWQELFGKYHVPAYPLPHDRVFHLQSDDPELAESLITEQTSGLNDRGESLPRVIQHFCFNGLSQQAVMQDNPLDNSQVEAHQVYETMLQAHRESYNTVRKLLDAKKDWG